jgi:hypothetical protein
MISSTCCAVGYDAADAGDCGYGGRPHSLRPALLARVVDWRARSSLGIEYATVAHVAPIASRNRRAHEIQPPAASPMRSGRRSRRKLAGVAARRDAPRSGASSSSRAGWCPIIPSRVNLSRVNIWLERENGAWETASCRFNGLALFEVQSDMDCLWIAA